MSKQPRPLEMYQVPQAQHNLVEELGVGVALEGAVQDGLEEVVQMEAVLISVDLHPVE